MVSSNTFGLLTRGGKLCAKTVGWLDFLGEIVAFNSGEVRQSIPRWTRTCDSGKNVVVINYYCPQITSLHGRNPRPLLSDASRHFFRSSLFPSTSNDSVRYTTPCISCSSTALCLQRETGDVT